MRRRPLGSGFVSPAVPSPNPLCNGKSLYPTFTMAALAAQRVSRARESPVEAYACRHCRRFHVGGVMEETLASRENRRRRHVELADDEEPMPVREQPRPVLAGFAARRRPEWMARTAVVIASGPSLTVEDVEAVRAARERDAVRVLAVSNAWKLTAGWADAHFAADRRYWKAYLAQMRAAGIPLERIFSSCNQTAREGTQFVRATNRPGLGVHELHTGGNSGYMAVNLAYLWGSLRIVLLGFDMQPGPAGEKHFDGNHPAPLVQAMPFDSWRKAFETMAKDLQRRGVTVVNCTRRTALACFPCAPLADELARVEKALV